MASGSAALRHKTTDAAARNGPLPLPTPQVFPMPCVVPESPGSSLSHHAFARYAHVSSSMYCPRPDVSRCRFSLLLRTPVSGNIPIQALTHPSRSMPSQDAWALRAATLGLRSPPTPPTTRSASVALEEAWRFSDGPMAHGRLRIIPRLATRREWHAPHSAHADARGAGVERAQGVSMHLCFDRLMP